MVAVFQKCLKGIKNPIGGLRYLASLGNGYRIRFKYGFLLKKACFGKNLRLRGKCVIKGPGKVEIGDNVYINGSGHPVTLFTHHSDAKIIIGSHSFLNGPRFGCRRLIEIGEYNILGDARIMDTDFHSIYPNRWSQEAEVLSGPVTLKKNVWVGGGAAVLKGVTIGENSVIGFGSVVSADVPENCLVAGNPAKLVKTL
jgi:acetyltransferase-like isoleucine patch superfamily enzyme